MTIRFSDRVSDIPDIRVVGEAPDGRTAGHLAAKLKPDVEMPGDGADGLKAAEAIAAESPETAVIILTMHADQERLDRAVAAGVRGGLPELVGAIRAVAEGGSAIDPKLMTGFLPTPLRPECPDFPGGRGLKASGRRTRKLGVSASTVKNRQKLNVTGRVAAAAVSSGTEAAGHDGS